MKNLLDLACKHPVKIVLSLLWLVLFLSGLLSYAGSKLVYVIFSIVFLVMLLSGIYRRVSYGYLFLVVFLWLGFWFKLTASYLLAGGRDFIFEEPIGNFISSADAWDQVLWVAMCASIGVMVGRLLFGLLFPKSLANETRAKAPLWYPAIRKWLWASVLLIIVSIALINILYGIHQVGLVPRTILHWPLNALIAWMLNLGSALAIAVLIWWDMAEERSIKMQLYAVLGEAFFSTVSVISRSMFPFHVIPQLLVLSGRKEMSQRYSRKQMLLFIATFAALLPISIAAVSILRDHQYSASKSTEAPSPQSVTDSAVAPVQPIQAKALAQPVKQTASFRLKLIQQLFVNRWIGIEGVMAVSSYPEKSSALFLEMLTEKREAGKVSAYQKICNSGYQAADSRYQFASLPGATAFFFFSGSLAMVVLGMALLSLFLLMIEHGIFALTQNPLICSLFGMTVANTIAQMGVTPRQDIQYLLLIISSAVVVYFLQSSLFASVFRSVKSDLCNKS